MRDAIREYAARIWMGCTMMMVRGEQRRHDMGVAVSDAEWMYVRVGKVAGS